MGYAIRVCARDAGSVAEQNRTSVLSGGLARIAPRQGTLTADDKEPWRQGGLSRQRWHEPCHADTPGRVDWHDPCHANTGGEYPL